MKLQQRPAYGGMSSEELLRISGRTSSSLRNGVDLSIRTHNCRSLSRNEFINHLLQEVERTSCNILGVRETRQKVCIHLEEVDSYICLGEEVNVWHNFQPDIVRRRAAG